VKPFAYVNGQWQPAARASSSDPPEREDVRIVTWNVWFGDHMFEERRAALIRELDRRRPDVIALQEVTPELLDHLATEPWVRSRYQLTDVEIWQRYDIVMLSRLPIREVTTLELPTQMGRRLLVVELACGLVVASVHLESMKESIAARETQLRLIQPFLAGLGGDTAFVGDMNFHPEDEIETSALDPEYVDVWPALHPGDPGFTADSELNAMRYMLKPKLSQKRIDRVFVRGRWRPTAIELVGTTPIDDDGTFTSDHFGLAVDLAKT